MLVAPAVNMGFSGGKLPGTINIRPQVVGLLVAEVLGSLAAQGLRNMFAVLAHGGSENLRAVEGALRGLVCDKAAFRKAMVVLARVSAFRSVWKEALAEGTSTQGGWRPA